jgi:succinate dehydrogenase flavin-adding protein (antitoxin of CptAB toxin-antitoxin module)
MPTANTYKAMIATTLVSTVVVFLAFTLHIKKKSNLIAETFYEMEPETIEEEKKEELQEILESLDNLLNSTTTNQAYNESNDELDKAFEEQLEEIRNRNNNETVTEALETNDASSSSGAASNEEAIETFDNINDIIAKTSEKKRAPSLNGLNKNSSISYSLVNRIKIDIPPPIYLCEMGGKVVITITVDSEGNVTETNYNNASTTDNGCLVDHAMEYAKASKFNADHSKPSQIGTITFLFKGKN